MWWRILLSIVVAVVVVAVGVAFIGTIATNRRNQQLVRTLLEEGRDTSGAFDPARLAGLPDPVAAYFRTVLTPGQPLIQSARFEQTGEIDLQGTWRPFTASQHVTTDPPGFVWDASVRMAPLTAARVVDRYSRGSGALNARIFGILTVADGGSSAELDSAELMRYLAEGVWYPTALLPGMGVSWTAVSDDSARATLSHDGSTVSLLFYFNDQSEIVRVEGDRYRLEGDKEESARWIGRFTNYAERGGMRIPLDGEVSWQLPDGEFTYWRGHIDEIEF